MYRDFSENSKKNLLSLVASVENDNISDFTDWVGDRWYDFQTSIGKLNIKNYINNVNEYHKKVIDKNNATKESIEKIFGNIAIVDSSYKKTFSSITNKLIQWQCYINELSQIVNPQNGQFESTDISHALKKQLIVISEIDFEKDTEKNEDDVTGNVLKKESKILKSLSKIFKDNDNSNDLKFASSMMSYFSGLYTFYTADYNDKGDIISGGLKLTKNSTKMWSGTYKFIEKNLKTLDASRFGKKYQSKVGVVALVGNILGLTGDSIDTYKTFIDEDAEGYEKIGALLNCTTSCNDVAKSVINLKYGQKVLSRDIHAKYQWGVPTKNLKIVEKATTAISVIGVIADTGKGFTDRYGKVSADGIVDSDDFAEIGVSGSVRGLTSVLGELSFGITDIMGLPEKSEVISDDIINFARTDVANFVRTLDYSSRYAESAQFLLDYADDENNNIVLRIGSSAIAGAGMIKAVAIDCKSEVCKWAGKKITDGLKTVINWF